MSFTDINFYIFCFFALRLLGIIKIKRPLLLWQLLEVSNAVRNNGLIALSFIAPTGGNETNTENDAKVRAELFLDSILEITCINHHKEKSGPEKFPAGAVKLVYL